MGSSQRRTLRKAAPRKKSTVILSEGEREILLTEGLRRAGVEGPEWTELGGVSYREMLPQEAGGPFRLEKLESVSVIVG